MATKTSTGKTTKPVAKSAKSTAAKPVAKPAKATVAKAPAKATTVKKPAVKATAAASKAPAAKRPPPTRDQRLRYVEVAAYYMAERRGFAPGNPAEDWLRAEAEIERLLAAGKINL